MPRVGSVWPVFHRQKVVMAMPAARQTSAIERPASSALASISAAVSAYRIMCNCANERAPCQAHFCNATAGRPPWQIFSA